MKSHESTLWYTLSIVTSFSLHQERPTSLAFSLQAKKPKQTTLQYLPPTEGFSYKRNSVYNTMRRPPPTSLPSREGQLLAYFSLCSVVPRGRWSRECSDDKGRGGGDGCWAGPREVMLTAPGALYTPLPIPPAALPNGNIVVSEFPLPSILKCWKKHIRNFLIMLLCLPHANDSPSLHSLPGEVGRRDPSLGILYNRGP